MNDEQFYLQAAEEVSQGTMKEALAAKAFAMAEGDAVKSRAIYMKLRVVQLKEEQAENRRVAMATENPPVRISAFALFTLIIIFFAVLLLIGYLPR